MNLNELKNELKRIDLSRRQYEHSFVHEQRKIITRIANKLIRSTSNLDVIFKGALGNNWNSQCEPLVNNSAIASSKNLSHQLPPPPSPPFTAPVSSIKREITNLGFNSNNDTIDSGGSNTTKKLPITSFLPLPPMIASTESSRGFSRLFSR